jgi:hypothetical protein
MNQLKSCYPHRRGNVLLSCEYQKQRAAVHATALVIADLIDQNP